MIADDQVGITENKMEGIDKHKLGALLDKYLSGLLNKPHEPTTFSAARPGHLIKLVVGLVQEYGALEVSEIEQLFKTLGVTDVPRKDIERYVLCAIAVEWLDVVSRGVTEYYVAKNSLGDAAVFYLKPTAKEKKRVLRRLLIREHWKKTDAQRFSVIAEVIEEGSNGV